jgi:Carbohydrate-selective porin, OprB family
MGFLVQHSTGILVVEHLAFVLSMLLRQVQYLPLAIMAQVRLLTEDCLAILTKARLSLSFLLKKGPFALRLQYTKGAISNVDVESGGVNVEWAFAKGAALFGRYGFGTINSRGVSLSASTAYGNFVNPGTGNSISPQTWMFGFAFPDLFKPGALAGIAVGQPFISSQVGNSSQTNLELFYNFPISDNIRITPDLQFIFNPNNDSTNGTVTVGTLRTVFSF